ncbi:MAG TPA: hypothetical protein VJ961_03285 [Mariprofundaceae bacterium]|nr:hypothetical protein [Mariprofundaceae bacterium]
MAPALQALYQRDNRIRIVLRTALPMDMLHRRSSFPFDCIGGQVDVGVVQKDALHEDVAATIGAVEYFHHDWHERVQEESRLLRRLGADLVLSDIAPLVFAAASPVGIPSIAIGSIDWHAIYSAFLPKHHFALRQIAEAHQACDLFLRLPLHMPITSFPRIKGIDLIVRKGRLSYDEARLRLEYQEGEKLVLVMFGGTRAPSFRIDRLDRLQEWRFIIPAARMPTGDIPANVKCAPDEWDVADLLQASDVVVSKPGYGVVSESWLAGKPLVYVPRTDFPEYPYLRGWLQENAPSCELGRAAFLEGAWGDALEAAFGSGVTYPPCIHGGESMVADTALAALDGGRVMVG